MAKVAKVRPGKKGSLIVCDKDLPRVLKAVDAALEAKLFDEAEIPAVEKLRARLVSRM